MAEFRLAWSLVDLRDEINRRWPNRDKRSDGWIGDAKHAARASDHNPWVVRDGVGIVRAIDVDVDGVDAGWLAEYLRQRGLTGHDGRTGDHRLVGGGYIIFNRRITKPDFSGWSVYNGSNPHTAHLHVSCTRSLAFDDRAGWGIAVGGPVTPPPPPPPPPPSGRPVLQRGSSGEEVRRLQAYLNRVYPLYSNLAVDGVFGPATERVVREFQRRSRIGVDGIVGPVTWTKLGIK
jgi:hypothetical protein